MAAKKKTVSASKTAPVSGTIKRTPAAKAAATKGKAKAKVNVKVKAQLKSAESSATKSATKSSTAAKSPSQHQRFRAVLNSSDNKLWGAHFEVPAKVAELYVRDSARRAVCTINGTERYQCGILRGVKSKFVITVNATIRKKLKLEFGDSLDIQLEADDSEYGLPITDEMKAALELDDEASALFHALTPGKQRTLLYVASYLKNPDVRALRAVCILEHLKKMKGSIDFKQLNLDLKAMSRPGSISRR